MLASTRKFMELMQALKKKDKAETLSALARGENPSQKDEDGGGAICRAIALGWEDVAIEMAERSVMAAAGSCVDDADGNGDEALLLSIESNMDRLATRLVELGADKGIQKDNNNAFAMAVSRGLTMASLAMVKSSVENARSSCLDDTDENGKEALILAIEKKNDVIAIALVEAGANMSCEYDSCSALPMAVKEGRLEVALSMVKRSVENARSSCLDDTDEDDKEALILAIEKGHDGLAIALIEAGANMSCEYDSCSALPMAVKEGRLEVALSMVKRSVERAKSSCLDDTDKDGKEALILAIEKGHDGLAIALIEAGANMSCEHDSCSAFPMSIHHGREAVAMSMIERSMESPRSSCLDDTDNESKAALIVAIEKGQEKIAKALVAAGANMESSNSDGVDAIVMAIHEKMDGLAIAMVGRGLASPRHYCLKGSDAEGKEAFFVAIEQRRLDVAKALAAALARSSLSASWEGCDAIPWAIMHGDQQVAEAMIDACDARGVDWKKQSDADGVDAPSLAARHMQGRTLGKMSKMGLPLDFELSDGGTLGEVIERLSRLSPESSQQKLALGEMAEHARGRLRLAGQKALEKGEQPKADMPERSAGALRARSRLGQ